MAAILPRIISLALVSIFTMVLGRADFSDQTTWYVYAAFINVVLTMGIETSFFRYYTTEKDKDGVLSTSASILMMTSGLFLVIGLMAGKYATSFLGFKDSRFVQILVLITVLDTLAVIPFAYLRVMGRPVRYMVVKLANVLILFITTVFLLIILPKWIVGDSHFFTSLGLNSGFTPGVIHIIFANLIASICTLFILIPELVKIKWKLNPDILRKLLNYGWPIMVGGIAFAINENLDKLLIQNLIDKESNGVYAACYKMGVFMTLYITAFRLGAEPFFFKHAHTENATSKYSKIMTWFVIFGCVFMVFITVYIDLLASIIIRNKVYLHGLYIVPIVLLANLFSGIYNNLSIWYKLTDRTRFGMYISLLGAGVTIISLLFFVPQMGIMGGAVATLFTYFIMAFVSWQLGRKYYPVPYHVPKLIAHIIMASIFCIISFLWFRNHFWINTGLFFLYFLSVMIMEKGEIKETFRPVHRP